MELTTFICNKSLKGGVAPFFRMDNLLKFHKSLAAKCFVFLGLTPNHFVIITFSGDFPLTC